MTPAELGLERVDHAGAFRRGAEAFTAGSADQVNFSQMANILERRVLAKRSQVKLLPDAVELADASAYTIFPELKEKAGRDGYTSARKSLKKHEALLLVQ